MFSREVSGWSVALLFCFSLAQVPVSGSAQTPPNLRRPNNPQPPVRPTQQKGRANDLGQPLEIDAEAIGVKYTQNRSQSPNLDPRVPQRPNTLELDPFAPRRNNSVNLIRIDTP